MKTNAFVMKIAKTIAAGGQGNGDVNGNDDNRGRGGDDDDDGGDDEDDD